MQSTSRMFEVIQLLRAAPRPLSAEALSEPFEESKRQFIFHLMDRNHRLLAGPLQRICY